MLDPTHLSDVEFFDALKLVAEQNKLLTWWEMCYGSPGGIEQWGKQYHWQRDFYDAGAFAMERMIMAANGVGKSETICAELAAHVTGQYPPWWRGKRFDRGGYEVWIGAIDNDMQKRGPQRALLGRNIDTDLGKGLLPASTIIDVKQRQAGVTGVADTVIVEHVSGENVTMKWLTFEQGWRKWQSGDPKIILWDEEPDENNVDQKDILSEVLTRLVRNAGIFLVGYTPLLGETQLTQHFSDSQDPAVWYLGAGWDDAPHLDEESKKRIIAEYPAHQRDARTRGIPMLGEGRIFRAEENSFLCDPIPIPDHWARITGVDFGLAHPAATAGLAHDRDTDIVYLYDCWRETNSRIKDHAAVINTMGSWIPVSWPHDGEQRDRNSGQRFHVIYRDKHGCRMLTKSARYDNKTGGGQPQWPIIEMMRERMETGKFKVFRTCQPFLQEYRSYHTKNGLIVSKKDDVLKATFYSLMMLRYAISKLEGDRTSHYEPNVRPFTTAVE